MKPRQKLSLKKFSETVETFLSQSAKSQLQEVIRRWAADTEPTERHAFLSRLTEKQSTPMADVSRNVSLLQDIDDILVEVENMATEEPDWELYEQDDEDSLGGFERFVEPLTVLFDRTEAAFDDGDFSAARMAYEKLFSSFAIESDYGQGVRPHDLPEINFEEVRARYLRATYLDTPLADRVASLLEAMTLGTATDFGMERPGLRDLVNNAVTPLPEFDEFLPRWIEVVKQKDGPQYDAWLREAVVLKDGVAGIENLALTEGKLRPRAFLDWISELFQNKRHEDAVKAAEVSLERLPRDLPIRAAIADHMVACAQDLKLPAAEARGRWITFETKPSLEKLIALFESAKGPERTKLMRRAADVISNHQSTQHKYERDKSWERDFVESPASVDNSLLAHAYLLAGLMEKALTLAKSGKTLGWSGNDNAQPLCVAYGLVHGTQLAPQDVPPRLRSLWVSAAHRIYTWSDSYFELETKEKRTIAQQIDDAYKHSMECHPLSPEFAEWCFKAAEARVNAIVSNNHRRAYDRAALLTVASYETMLAIQNEKEAKNFVNRIRDRFPRHSAFQRELQALLR